MKNVTPTGALGSDFDETIAKGVAQLAEPSLRLLELPMTALVAGELVEIISEGGL